MTTPCMFPACDHPATTANRANQPTCAGHRPVVVSASGSWLDDAHHGAACHG
jgi:hypothetical protein